MKHTDPAALARFCALIEARLGLVYQARQLPMLDELLHRRLTRLSVEVTPYLNALEAGLMPDEFDALAPELTVGETYFFRNIEQFHALRELVLPQLIEGRRGSRRLRVLSAGCASGEELYSIAMLMQDLSPGIDWDISLLGVDLNPVVLKKARTARYSNWSLRETPETMRQRWFRQDGAEFVLDPLVRDSARFEQLNLSALAPDFWRPGAFDLIFARNVLMYFNRETLLAAIARIAASLTPGGYFFLGHSESLRELSTAFNLCHTHGTFYYQRKGGAADPPALAQDQGDWFAKISKASERVRGLTGNKPGAPPAAAKPAPALDPLQEALTLFGQERFDAVEQLLDAVGLQAHQNTDLLLLRAMLRVHDGLMQEAEDIAHASLTRDRHCAAAHYVIALCRESLGDLSAAANRYGKAAQLDPGFALPHLHLGLLARRRNDVKTQQHELSHAMNLLAQESSQRLLMFGGGFDRAALLNLCRAGLRADGVLT